MENCAFTYPVLVGRTSWHVPKRLVDDICERLTGELSLEVGQELASQRIQPTVEVGGHVRRHDDAGHAP